MNLNLTNDLQNKKTYWRIRQWFIDKPYFLFWKKVFGVSYFLEERKEGVHLLKKYWGSILKGILYSAVFVVSYEYLDKVLPINSVLDFFHVHHFLLKSETIDSFLTTVASVSGVFLGLYFAALSSVAGNLLIKAPDKVRRLFLEDREGLHYITTLVLTGVISAFYLIFKSIGFSISFYSLISLLLLTIYNIIIFKDLGLNLFSLRSIEVASTATYEISKSIKVATKTWKNKNKPFIQAHLSTRATSFLIAFKQLVEFSIETGFFSMEQINDFMRFAGGLLVFYPDQKRKIATNSLWFKTKRRHKKWILTDSTEIILALNTGTSLHPEEIRDYVWLERDTAEILNIIHNYFLKKKSVDYIISGIEIYVQVFENGITNNLITDEQKLLIDQLRTFLDSTYNDSSFNEKELLGIADSDGRTMIGLSLDFTKYLQSLNEEKIDNNFSANKIAFGDIYDGTIPQSVLARAEELRSNLNNEQQIEGRLVTADWYIKNLLVFRLFKSIQIQFEFIKTLHSSYYETRIDALVESKKMLVAVQLLQRWLEFCNKYQVLISTMKKTVDILNQYNKQFDIEWPVFDFDKEQEKAEEYERYATDKMTRLLPMLDSDLVNKDDLPDYFGQAYTFGVEACYQACMDNNPERLKRIFAPVFVASIVAFTTTREDTKDWSQEGQVVFSSEPLTDITEITGYAKLYSELYQNPAIWEVCKNVWDIYLTHEEAEHIITIIATSAIYRNSLFATMPKATIRTNWAINFQNKLREKLNLLTDNLHFYDTDIRSKIDHPSNLIRALAARGIMLPVNAQNVFFITYLKKHPMSKDIIFPEDREDIEGKLGSDNNYEDL